MPKVLLFTSQGMGNDILTALLERYDVDVQVVTQRTQRDEIYGYRSIYDLCVEKEVPVLSPRRLDDPFIESVRKLAPDLILCAYFPHIFPISLIDIPPLGCVNVHPGALPDYRGTFPTPWCILNNERKFGITLHLMDDGIDTGDILVQRHYPIGETETGHELYKRAMDLAAELLLDNLDALLEGSLSATPQAPGGSYYNRIDPQYRIDWHHHRQHICNQIRVHAKPYFPAYSYLINKCVIINRAQPYEHEGYRAQLSGKIIKVFDDGTFVVSCVDGCLKVEEFEMFPVGGPAEIELHIRAGNRFS